MYSLLLGDARHKFLRNSFNQAPRLKLCESMSNLDIKFSDIKIKALPMSHVLVFFYPTCCSLVRFIEDAARDGPCAHGKVFSFFVSCSPNLVLTHAARAAAKQLNKPLRGRARRARRALVRASFLCGAACAAFGAKRESSTIYFKLTEH